jgi:glycerol kinase
MNDFVIGIDQGTTGTLVGIMNPAGEMIRQAYQEHKQYYPGPG